MAEENQARTSAPDATSTPGPHRTGLRPARRRPSFRRSRWPRQVFPPQESVQVLHREDRCDSLPRCPAAARICGRARQDRAAAAHRRLHHAPAPADPRHQAGPEHRPAAVCHAALSGFGIGGAVSGHGGTWLAAASHLADQGSGRSNSGTAIIPVPRTILGSKSEPTEKSRGAGVPASLSSR